jgi:DNA-binding FadR family transcriptional regulator
VLSICKLASSPTYLAPMTQFSDLTEDVFRRALKTLETKIPAALHARISDLVASGEIANAKILSETIAKHVDSEVLDGQNP